MQSLICPHLSWHTVVSCHQSTTGLWRQKALVRRQRIWMMWSERFIGSQQNRLPKNYYAMEVLKRIKKTNKLAGKKTVLVENTSKEIKRHKILKRATLNAVL